MRNYTQSHVPEQTFGLKQCEWHLFVPASSTVLDDPAAPVLHLSQYGGPFLVAQITGIPTQFASQSFKKQLVPAPATKATAAALPPPIPVEAKNASTTKPPVLHTATDSVDSKVTHESIVVAPVTKSGTDIDAGTAMASMPNNQSIGTLEAVVVWVHRYRLQRGVAMLVTPSTTLRNFLDIGILLYLHHMAPRVRQPGDAPGTSTDGSGGYGIGSGYGPIRKLQSGAAIPIKQVETQSAVDAAPLPKRWEDIPGGFQVRMQTV